MSQAATVPAPADRAPDPASFVPKMEGRPYRAVLAGLHATLRPRRYLEIGVHTGATLALAGCASIGVDPRFALKVDVLGRKPSLQLFQTTSEEFFARHDPAALLGGPVDLAFLDGLHHAEALLDDFIGAERCAAPGSVIVLHDCLPTDIAMTRRQGEKPARPPVHKGWWTGDVWRLLPVLRRHRPDLRIDCLGARPTGLVLVSRLDPGSGALAGARDAIVEEMRGLDLTRIGLRAFLDAQDIRPPREFTGQALLDRFAPFGGPAPPDPLP